MTIPMSRCPKCETLFSEFNPPGIENLKAGQTIFGQRQINALSFYCPSCKSCLGIQPDPSAWARDVAREVKAALGKLR
jgi:hypothetical protein